VSFETTAIVETKFLRVAREGKCSVCPHGVSLWCHTERLQFVLLFRADIRDTAILETVSHRAMASLIETDFFVTL
jgi:hypothetical protein